MSASFRKPAAAAGVAALQAGLTGDRVLAGASYMENPALLRAYLEYYWPVSHAQALHALRVSAPALAEAGFGRFRTVIDAGSGPGPVAAAFAAAGCDSLVLADSSSKALDLARRIIPERTVPLERPAPPPCSTLSIETVCMDIADPDPALIPMWGKADCISFGHSLNEIAPGAADRVERRVSVLERWAGALSPAHTASGSGGVILVIEPALLSTSRDLLAVRNMLVSRGWRVLAPCVGRSALACPALDAGESQTCHTDVLWEPNATVSRIAESLGISKDTLKMTWFFLQPPRSLDSSQSPGSEHLGATHTGATHTGATHPGGVAAGLDAPYPCRVVSEPMLNKGGRLRRLVCGEKGRFPLSVPAGSPEAERTFFEFLVRGELVIISEPECRDSGWGIGPRTRLDRPEADAIPKSVRSAPINRKVSSKKRNVR